jgi:hypothetical protein
MLALWSVKLFFYVTLLLFLTSDVPVVVGIFNGEEKHKNPLTIA